MIDDRLEENQNRLFVGRAKETLELQAAFAPPGLRPPSLTVLKGLPGIGRRALLKRVAKDSLNFSRLLPVEIEVGDNLQSIVIKVADMFYATASPDETLATAREIEQLDNAAAMERMFADLVQAVSLGELIVFYDAGGLLLNDGSLSPPVAAILGQLSEFPDLNLVLITNRRPHSGELRDLGLADSPIVEVGPLSDLETKQLMSLIGRMNDTDLHGVDLNSFLGQIRGYPPAAYAAVSLVKRYGCELAVGPTKQASEFQPRPLHRYLASLEHGSAAKKILAVLARNSPLPIELLVSFAKDATEARQVIADSIDASLVVPRPGTSWYQISDPIVDYIEREYPACTIEDYKLISASLDDYLSQSTDVGPTLELSRVLYRAFQHSGGKATKRAYALRADWLRLAEEFYHARNYEQCLVYAVEAEAAIASSAGLEWAIKARIKLGRHEEALGDIERLRRLGEIADAHYYRGFLERDRRNTPEAIQHYLKAKAVGRGGLAIERDLAECYFLVGNLEKASEHVAAAQSKQSDNPFVIDLRIKIACSQRDEETARALLPMLEQVDRPGYAAHRASRVELTFGDPGMAYTKALQAVSEQNRPSPEVLSNLILCELKVGKVADATSNLQRFKRLYGHRSSDVLTGLEARVAIAEQRYEDAVQLAESFRDSNGINLEIRRAAIRGLLENTLLNSAEKARHAAEVVRLDERLAAVGAQDFTVDGV